MNKFLSLFLVIRPHNVSAAVLSTGVGFSIAGSTHWPWRLLASVAVATAAGNVVNDLYDIDIDRINKPRRPLPSGALTPRTVKVLYVVLLCALVLLIYYLPAVQAVWIITWAVLLHLYSSSLKRIFLVGNVLVSAVSASGFLLGAFVGGWMSAGVIPACFTFIFVMGRELVKDCEDLGGDSSCGARTLPVVSGERTALAAAVVIFSVLAVCFPLPYLLGLYGKGYGLIIMLSVVPILVVSIVLSLRVRYLGLVSTLLKLGMFFGIVAFYFANPAHG